MRETPARNVTIGGKRTVLVPAYGPPFVHDLDKGRRYATIEDFENFRQTRLHGAGNSSFGWHRLRAS